VIQTAQGEILDWTNPFSGSTYCAEGPDESIFVLLPDDELPDMVDDAALDFWRKRLSDVA
jgi:hypothetical protein